VCSGQLSLLPSVGLEI